MFRLCLCLGLLALGRAASIEDSANAGIREVLKLSTIRNNKYDADLKSVMNELEDLKGQFRVLSEKTADSVFPDMGSIEWAHEAVDTLRAELGALRSEMADIHATARAWKASDDALKAVLRPTPSSTATAEAVLMTTSGLPPATEATTANYAKAEIEALKNELSKVQTDIKATLRQLNISNKEIHTLKEQIKVINVEHKMSFMSFNALTQKWAKQSQAANTNDLTPSRKLRHFHLLSKQVRDLKKSYTKLNSAQNHLTDQIIRLQAKLEAFAGESSVLESTKIQDIMEIQIQQRHMIQNITSDVGNFNTLHKSMMQLLENMENLEEKVDTTLPQFKKEISKLDVDMAQLNSHHDYLQNNHESVRQSVKAIAVSVSNMVDRVDADHVMLETQNKSISHLENQAKLHFYRLADHITKTEALQAQNESTLGVEDMPELIGELKELKEVEREYHDIVKHLPKDCGDKTLQATAGNVLIAPGVGPAVETYCNNGWTLMQSRFNGSVDFNRRFQEYSDGFGSPNGEFWIGNDALHRLTKDNCTSLKVNMRDIYGNYWTANYLEFNVGSASTGYHLTVGGFSGNASDALNYQNGMEFSAIDRDRDISNSNCAASYEGGWWFSHCQHANLNGKYILGLTWFDSEQNEWIAIASSRMELQTRPGCKAD